MPDIHRGSLSTPKFLVLDGKHDSLSIHPRPPKSITVLACHCTPPTPGCIKPPGASLSPTEPETSKPSLRPRIVFKPLSGAPRQAPSVPPNQETTAGATVVASARATLQIGAEPGVELFGGVISRPESEGLPWLHSELQVEYLPATCKDDHRVSISPCDGAVARKQACIRVSKTTCRSCAIPLIFSQ